MNKRHVQWLYDELPELVGNGIIAADCADRLRTHYGAVAKQDARRTILLLFGILGATLIGGGIILLLAHNWEQLGRPLRALIAFIPLLAAQALAAWTLRRRNESAAWREGVATGWTLSIGATISLIAQTYNFGGSFGTFMLTWVLLAAPIIHLLRSNVVAALYWVGVTTWAVNARMTHGIELWFWPLMALAVPRLWQAAQRSRHSTSVGGLTTVLIVCAAIGIGMSLDSTLAQYWGLAYASFFTVLWMAGRRWFGAAGLRGQPLQRIGAFGLTALALVLTLRWPWTEWGSGIHQADYSPVLYWLRVAMLGLWTTGAVVLGVSAARRRDLPALAAGAMPMLAAVGLFLGPRAASVMPYFFDVYLLAIGVVIVVAGVRERRLAMANQGMLVLSALIVTRFFDSGLDFVSRGLAFVVVGIGFLATNILVARKMKAVTA